jgi:hypothetical protein
MLHSATLRARLEVVRVFVGLDLIELFDFPFNLAVKFKVFILQVVSLLIKIMCCCQD